MFNSKLQLLTRRQFHELLASRLARPVRISVECTETRTAHSTRACGLDRHSRHATRLLDCGLLELHFSPHSRSPLSVFVGRATAIPGLTALRALCSLGARTGVLPRGVLTSCAVQVQYPVRRVGTWWGGVAFRFVREQSRTVEYKSLKCRRRRADYVYDLCRAASSLTYYQLLGILAATTSTAVLCAHAYTW